LPIWIAVFSGTSAGAVLGEHWGLAAVALTGLFVASAAGAMRMFGRKG
jgi:mercuric ion transport protein